MSKRWIAFINETTGSPRTRHVVGLPPELTDGTGEPAQLPRADVLVLVERDGGSFMMYRYTQDHRFGGDTWHEDLEAAHEQAVFEFGEALSEWVEVPDNMKDAVTYATVERVRRRFKGRTFSDS